MNHNPGNVKIAQTDPNVIPAIFVDAGDSLLSLRNVSYSYPGSTGDTLLDVTLHPS